MLHLPDQEKHLPYIETYFLLADKENFLAFLVPLVGQPCMSVSLHNPSAHIHYWEARVQQ